MSELRQAAVATAIAETAIAETVRETRHLGAEDVAESRRLTMALHIAVHGDPAESNAAMGRARAIVADLALVLGVEGPW